MTTKTIPADNELFDGGPPRRLEAALRLINPEKPKAIRGTVLVAVIAWAPLILLAAMQSLVLGQDKLSDLLFDFTVHARYLVAAPLFIATEPCVLSTLENTARHFIEAELIRESDRVHFESIAASTWRLLNSKLKC
jgi:hypothetical protein